MRRAVALTTVFAATGLLVGPLLAQAQQGLATGSTIQGHNTIQQAPSGGTTHNDPGLDLPDAKDAGRPTAEERQIEKQNNAATQICKGC